MFDETSRYKDLPTAVYRDQNGVDHAYVTQRYLPPAETLTIATQAEVLPGDRLDIVAHRVYGASDQYWRIADAEMAREPEHLTDETGRFLAVPLAATGGPLSRG